MTTMTSKLRLSALGLSVAGCLTGLPAHAGAAGAWLGDRYHRQQANAATLTADLDHSEAQRAQLTAQVTQLDDSLAQTRARDEKLGATLQQADQLGLDVSFRTDDDGVAVQAMGPLLKLLPQAQLRVAGYADPRGSPAYNEQLSRRRAASVAAVLTAAGVPQERILIEAHGNAQASAADGDLDAYALERRVTVRVELPVSGQVARRD